MYESTLPPAGVYTSDALCDWSADCGIGVYDRRLTGTPALCVCTPDFEAVAVDGRRLDTEAQRRCAIAHELGHLRTGAMYDRLATPAEVRRAERRADTWAVYTLIPRDALERALERGYTELWQLADLFCVTEKFAASALRLYGFAD